MPWPAKWMISNLSLTLASKFSVVAKDALLASDPAGNKGQGLIEAYQKNPQKFKRYADLLDKAMNAKQVGYVVLRQAGSHPPRISEPLQMDANLKVDAWGSPFCIIPVGESVAVVSGGPSRLSCDALPLTSEQIAKSNRNMYAGPSDSGSEPRSEALFLPYHRQYGSFVEPVECRQSPILSVDPDFPNNLQIPLPVS